MVQAYGANIMAVFIAKPPGTRHKNGCIVNIAKDTLFHVLYPTAQAFMSCYDPLFMM